MSTDYGFGGKLRAHAQKRDESLALLPTAAAAQGRNRDCLLDVISRCEEEHEHRDLDVHGAARRLSETAPDVGHYPIGLGAPRRYGANHGT